MIIEYLVNCFDRVLKINLDECHKPHEKEILDLLEKYYFEWHNPEDFEDQYEREYVENSCCEEYMVTKLSEKYKVLEWGNDGEEETNGV